MKSNASIFFKLLNNEFRKLLQKIRSFLPLIINERLLEAGISVSPKNGNFRVQIKGMVIY